MEYLRSSLTDEDPTLTRLILLIVLECNESDEDRSYSGDPKNGRVGAECLTSRSMSN